MSNLTEWLVTKGLTREQWWNKSFEEKQKLYPEFEVFCHKRYDEEKLVSSVQSNREVKQ